MLLLQVWAICHNNALLILTSDNLRHQCIFTDKFYHVLEYWGRQTEMLVNYDKFYHVLEYWERQTEM